MPFFKVRASSLEQFEAIIEAKDENEAYQIGKEDGGLFNSIDIIVKCSNFIWGSLSLVSISNLKLFIN